MNAPEHSYVLHELMRLEMTFTDPDDRTHQLDPDSITLEIYAPDGTVTAVYLAVVGEPDGIVRDGTGVYHADFDPSQPGMHSWRVRSTGAAQAAGQRRFYVRHPAPFTS